MEHRCNGIGAWSPKELWASAVRTVASLALAWPLVPGVAHAQPDVPAAAGAIEGTVIITRKLTSQRMRFRVYPGFKPQPPPQAARESGDERSNVIVYLASKPEIAATHAVGTVPRVEQAGETFIPHVLPVLKGTTVAFPNRDPIFHNVFSLSSTKSFDLGRYPKGDSRSVTFDQPGIVPVFCHLHSNMSAIIMVLDNPFFSKPDSDGRFRIDEVPAGSYTLVGWHERSDRVEHQVEVMPGETAEVSLVIPIEDVPPSD